MDDTGPAKVIDPCLLDNLICPIDRMKLYLDKQSLVSAHGRRYPIVELGPLVYCCSKKGFSVVGIDPSLSAVMAARRLAKTINLDIKYVVADGAFLPFRDGQFDFVYSYSVLQHFSEDDARAALSEIGRLLERGVQRKCNGKQMGYSQHQQQARRQFRPADNFEVRYWAVSELKSPFSETHR